MPEILWLALWYSDASRVVQLARHTSCYYRMKWGGLVEKVYVFPKILLAFQLLCLLKTFVVLEQRFQTGGFQSSVLKGQRTAGPNCR